MGTVTVDKAALARLPERAADVKGGELGAQYRRWDAQAWAASQLRRRMADFERQRAGWQRSVDHATPESDMVAVAAAQAGVFVLQRAINRLSPDLADAARHEEEEERVYDRLVTEFYDRRKKLADLEAGRRVDDDRESRPWTRARLLGDLERLTGLPLREE